MGETGDKDLVHIMSYHTRAERKDGVDHQQLSLGKHVTRGYPAQEKIKDHKEKEGENNIEEKGHCGRVPGVGDDLHIGYPDGVRRYEQKASDNCSRGYRFLQGLSPFLIKVIIS